MPPTERRGRVHTSTVTVAVLNPEAPCDPRLLMRSPADFRLEWFSGTGAGGQFRNKHQNSARLIHVPTGMKQESQTRSRENSLRLAREGLLALLDAAVATARRGATSEDRRAQVGSGMRGDKVRTYRFQEGVVRNHRNGRSAQAAVVMRGGFDVLW